MSIERVRIQIGDCPSPGKMKGITERLTGAALQQSYDSEENRLTVTVYLLPEGRIKPDKVVELSLCPQGQQCACMYQTGLSWEATSNCDALFEWQWPERGGCLQKTGQLSGDFAGLIHNEELSGDPGHTIYKVGDSRNPDCPGCGMAGRNRSTIWNVPVPGEGFSLIGCYDEEACYSLYGGETPPCIGVGSKYWETTGFCGGQIISVIDQDSGIYQVSVKGQTGTAHAVDRSVYDVGEWVALLKIGCEFPTGEYETPPVTSDNVCTLQPDDYFIMPYHFRGE